jgi:hypothetical protein
MTPRFTQVEKGRWPNGIDKPIAVLRAEPDELAARYGLQFRAGSDDFDRFQEAALRLRSGRPVLLYRYERSPSTGTTVTIDQVDRAREALDELIAALELRRRGITWVSDEVAAGATAVEAAGGRGQRMAGAFSNWFALLFGRARLH